MGWEERFLEWVLLAKVMHSHGNSAGYQTIFQQKIVTFLSI